MQPWGSTLFTNGVILGAGMVGGVLAARFLGVEDRGLFAAIIYWPHFIAGIASMGINEGIVIRTAKFGATETLRATTFAISIALAVPVGILGFLLMPLLLGESRQEYLLFSQIYLLAFLPITFLAQNLLAVDQGELKFHRFNTQRIVQAIAYPLLLLVLWAVGILTVEYAAIAVFLGTAIVALHRIWDARSSLREGPSRQEAHQLLRTSYRLHIVNVVMALSMQVDKMALLLFSNNTELGLYIVSITAASAFVSLLVQTYINIMLPTAARVGAEREHIQDLIVPLRRLIGIIVLSTGFFVLFMPYLIILVYGTEFEAAAPYAQVLLLAFAFVGIKQAMVYILRSWGINRPALFGEGVTVVIMIAGVYFAIQWWGTMGLCFLVMIAQIAGAAFIGFRFLSKAGLTLKQFVSFVPIIVRQ